jgi:hypothetical protein
MTNEQGTLKIGTTGYKLNPEKLKGASQSVLPYILGCFYFKEEYEYFKSKLKNEEADLYDIILSHLLDEGYAETPEAAEAIMVNMSEEWMGSIIG